MKSILIRASKVTISVIVCFHFLFITGLNPSHELKASAKAPHIELTDAIQQQFSEMTSKMVSAIPNNDNTIQVFDVSQGHVIKRIDNNAKFEKQLSRILKGITEFAPEVQPDMKAKYIIRLPIETGTTLTVNNSTITINQLFIFYYVDKEPIILAFDENKHPFLFHTSTSIKPLLKLIQLN